MDGDMKFAIDIPKCCFYHGLMVENHRKMVVKNGGLMGFNQQNGDFNGIYPLVNVYSFLLKMAIEIIDLSVKNGDFP